MNNHSLTDTLPFWHFDREKMIFDDGSMGAGFRIFGYDISTNSNDEIDEISKKIENFILNIPEDHMIQIFYRMRHDVSPLIKTHGIISDSSPIEYKDILDSRVNYFKNQLAQKNFFKPEIYLFVRTQGSPLTQSGWSFQGKKFVQITKDEYRTQRKVFNQTLRQLQSALRHAGLEPVTLNSQEWFYLLFEYFNLERSEKFPVPKLSQSEFLLSSSLNSQLILTDTSVYPDHLKLGKVCHRVTTLKSLPEGITFPSMIQSLIQLPFHYWISQQILVPNQKTEVDKLNLQRRLAHSLSTGNNQLNDLESESKRDHIENLVRELLEGSEKIVYSDITVHTWDEDLSTTYEKSDEVIRAFSDMNHAQGIAETLPTLDIFIQSAPGVCGGRRPNKMKATNAAHLAPVFSYWSGNEKPTCLIENQEGGLVAIDPTTPQLPNWNGLVIGGSGYGKSFSILQFLLMYYGQSPTPKIVWIDNGASSKRAIEVLNGQFIEISLGSGYKINPFSLPQGETRPSPVKMKLLLGVLESILKEQDQKGLPKREKALIEQCISDIYDKCFPAIPTLSDLREYFSKHENPALKNYADILYSWTGDSPYGQLLDGQSNISLEKNLVTVEIRNLDKYPDLKDVILLIFTDWVMSQAAQSETEPYTLIIDEGWRLFKTPAGASFTEECYRTFRKFNAQLWCISQNYKDVLSQPEIADAILPNTTNIFILKQKGIDWSDFQSVLSLNDRELEIIKNLQFEKGRYSEIFYIQDDKRSVLRLRPDPLSYWIATTDPKDKLKIEETQKKNPELPLIEVLKLIVKERTENELF